MNDIILYENVESKILTIRNQQVIIDRDVAELYGVETKRINEAVKNNPDKFPEGYIISLDDNEKSDVVEIFDHLEILKYSHATPSAFTEKGLYMLATILKSPTATQTTIAIINAFANIRELNRIIKRFPSIHDEMERTSLTARAGDVLWEIFDDSMMEISGKDTSMKFKLPFLEVRHTVKCEKRKDT